MNGLMIGLSLVIALLLALRVYHQTGSRRHGVLLAFLVNSVLLGGAVLVQYALDTEAQLFGGFEAGYLYLLVAIPISSWLVGIGLQFYRFDRI